MVSPVNAWRSRPKPRSPRRLVRCNRTYIERESPAILQQSRRRHEEREKRSCSRGRARTCARWRVEFWSPAFITVIEAGDGAEALKSGGEVRRRHRLLSRMACRMTGSQLELTRLLQNRPEIRVLIYVAVTAKRAARGLRAGRLLHAFTGETIQPLGASFAPFTNPETILKVARIPSANLLARPIPNEASDVSYASPVCSWKVRPAWITAKSSPALPTNWSPTGRFFSVNPQGTDIAEARRYCQCRREDREKTRSVSRFKVRRVGGTGCAAVAITVKCLKQGIHFLLGDFSHLQSLPDSPQRNTARLHIRRFAPVDPVNSLTRPERINERKRSGAFHGNNDTARILPGPTGKATSFTLEKYFLRTLFAVSIGFATPGARDFHAFVSQPTFSGRECNSWTANK